MACISCEKYEKRVSNVYRDEELREKFYGLTGYEIICDCFICDCCNEKLMQAVKFKENCILIYKKNNPDQFPKSSTQSTAIDQEGKEYFILETNEDVLMNEDDDTISQNQFIQINQTAGETEDQDFSVYEIDESPSKIPRRDESIEERSEEYLNSTEDEQKSSAVKGRKSYSLAQKLEIIEYSEKHSNREASRHFSLNESTVRCFRRQKQSLQDARRTKSTNRRGTPFWPELEIKLKEWTEEQKKKPKINEIRTQAIKLAKELGHTSFNGSLSWTFKFMQRNQINSSQPRPRKQGKSTIDV